MDELLMIINTKNHETQDNPTRQTTESDEIHKNIEATTLLY